MSFISYVPTKEGCIIAFNRDEFFLRDTDQLIINTYKDDQIGNTQLLYPEDPFSNGTWMACSNSGTIVCMLNGAEQKHETKGHYEKSRGLLLLEVIRYGNIVSFFEHRTVQQMEPFTLIAYENKLLYEVKWNGKQLKLTKKNELKYNVWSSVLQFNTEEANMREKWFRDGLDQIKSPNADAIRAIHLLGGSGNDELGLIRKNLASDNTLSICSAEILVHTIDFAYFHLSSNTLIREQMLRTR